MNLERGDVTTRREAAGRERKRKQVEGENIFFYLKKADLGLFAILSG